MHFSLIVSAGIAAFVSAAPTTNSGEVIYPGTLNVSIDESVPMAADSVYKQVHLVIGQYNNFIPAILASKITIVPNSIQGFSASEVQCQQYVLNANNEPVMGGCPFNAQVPGVVSQNDVLELGGISCYTVIPSENQLNGTCPKQA